MTTIAYHHESQIIAVDSRRTRGSEIISDNMSKILVNGAGTWVLCGAVSDYDDFVSLKKNDIFNSAVKLDVSGLLIRESSAYSVYISDGVFCEELIDCNYACGSGREWAKAAMDFGKSASGAVEYAMTRDAYTGGEVREVICG